MNSNHNAKLAIKDHKLLLLMKQQQQQLSQSPAAQVQKMLNQPSASLNSLLGGFGGFGGC
ncbi:MAG TPA: hypothetical protein DEF27_12285 [Oscillatoriales bacterium UBA8482]|nr:MAG: hypothetical protein AUK43_11530 [Oscillatoriales cyanobacterium CG2_30_40_61]HBW58530.1 hypothetical protein [Oscillatoriales bacterium UBA8482]